MDQSSSFLFRVQATCLWEKVGPSYFLLILESFCRGKEHITLCVRAYFGGGSGAWYLSSTSRVLPGNSFVFFWLFSAAHDMNASPPELCPLTGLSEGPSVKSWKVSLSFAYVRTAACFLPTPHPGCRHTSREPEDVRRIYQGPLGSRRGLSSDSRTVTSFSFLPNGRLVLSRRTPLPCRTQGQRLTLLSPRKSRQSHPLVRDSSAVSMRPDSGQGDLRGLLAEPRKASSLLRQRHRKTWMSLDRAPGLPWPLTQGIKRMAEQKEFLRS